MMHGTCSNCGHSLSHDAPIIIGDWIIDPSGVTLYKGQRIPFTARENETLFVIAKANGRVIKKISIEMRLDFGAEYDVVQQLIYWIRKKMDAAAGFNTIETVSGEGYRWRT